METKTIFFVLVCLFFSNFSSFYQYVPELQVKENFWFIGAICWCECVVTDIYKKGNTGEVCTLRSNNYCFF